MSLEINKQRMQYSLSIGTQPEYKMDEDGNIVYSGYMDSDGEFIYYLDENTGEKIPEYTGNQIEIYSEPVIFYSSISNKLSEATAKEFGIDDSTNYAQVVTDKNAFPLVEGALIWKRSEVGYKDNNKTIIDSTSADYIVKGVADEGLTVDLYLLRKNVKNAE